MTLGKTNSRPSKREKITPLVQYFLKARVQVRIFPFKMALEGLEKLERILRRRRGVEPLSAGRHCRQLPLRDLLRGHFRRHQRQPPLGTRSWLNSLKRVPTSREQVIARTGPAPRRLYSSTAAIARDAPAARTTPTWTS